MLDVYIYVDNNYIYNNYMYTYRIIMRVCIYNYMYIYNICI